MPSISSTSAVHPLAAWRRRRQLTLAQLGETLRQNPQNLHRYEQGERLPPPDVRKRIQTVTRGAVPADDEFWFRARLRALKGRETLNAARARAVREELRAELVELRAIKTRKAVVAERRRQAARNGKAVP